MKVRIKVTPNARSNAITGWENDILKIRLRAAPEKGKANEALIEFLAETLQIRPSRIQILRGHTSRIKEVEIQDLDEKIFQRAAYRDGG